MKFRASFIGSMIVIAGAVHFLLATGSKEWHWAHLALEKFRYVPILLAAGWFGLGGALSATALVTLFFALHVAMAWPSEHMAQANTLAELANPWLVAVVSGFLADRLRQALLETRGAHDETLRALAGSLELREQYTAGHSARVRDYALLLADQLRLDDAARKDLALGAFLHDIGKIATPDAVLLKEGALTADEWRTMQRHPDEGADLIGRIASLASARDIVRSHHERWDGQGYPRGLKDGAIPRGARIFAVADILDAMTTNRPYHRAAAFDEAAAEIERGRGTQFDPAVVDAFQRVPKDHWADAARRHGVVLKFLEYAGGLTR